MNRLITVLLTTLFFHLFSGGYGVLLFSQSGTGSFDLAHTLVAFGYQFILFLLLSLHRYTFYLLIPPIFLAASIAAYFSSQLGIEIDRNVLAAVFATDYQEASEILSGELLLYAAVSLLASLSVVFIYKYFVYARSSPRGSHEASKRRFGLVMAVVLLGALGFRLYHYPPSYLLRPFSLNVLQVPSPPEEIQRIAQLIWPGSTFGMPEKSTYKGRIRYDLYQAKTGKRLRLHASRGDFSIKTRYVKHTYDRNGVHLETRFYWPDYLSTYRLNNFTPFSLASELFHYTKHRIALSRAAAKLVDISTFPSYINPDRANNLTVVLIIGESARADHFQLNGYRRPTNPELSRIPRLVNFSRVWSCAASTTIAIPCLLTRMTAQDLPDSYNKSATKTYIYQPVATENSFISLFNKHQFTTAWFSLNQNSGRKNAPISVMLQESDDIRFLSTGTDGALLSELDNFLSEVDGPALIILHTRGSHWRYRSRYPRNFARYRTTCKKNLPSKCRQTDLINAYDNSILYTDYFISEVIQRLEDRKAIMVYTSDHGESLGEEGVFTHSVMSRPEQRAVPMLWWVSADFERQNPKVLTALKSHQAEPISHDYLFHSILDCAGIKSTVVDTRFSLCAQ